MKHWPVLCLGVCAALSGCVFGYGRCLFLSPVEESLTGKLHFRSYPVGGGIDHVAVLALDSTAYVYAPGESRYCEAVNQMQLTGWSEYPPDLTENVPVTVSGSLIPSTSPRQHTKFLIKVHNIERILAIPLKHPAAPHAANR